MPGVGAREAAVDAAGPAGAARGGAAQRHAIQGQVRERRGARHFSFKGLKKSRPDDPEVTRVVVQGRFRERRGARGMSMVGRL